MPKDKTPHKFKGFWEYLWTLAGKWWTLVYGGLLGLYASVDFVVHKACSKETQDWWDSKILLSRFGWKDSLILSLGIMCVVVVIHAWNTVKSLQEEVSKTKDYPEQQPKGPAIFLEFPLIAMGSTRYLVVQNNGPGLAYSVHLKVPGSTVSSKDIELVKDDKELYAFRSKEGKYISTFDFIMFGAKHLPAFVVLMDGNEDWFEYTFVESDPKHSGFKFMGQKYIGKTRPT
jgi:hypothetical protein